MQVLARIQGHPSRRHLHEPLAEAIGLETEVLLHATVPPNPWWGYIECLSNLPSYATHVLVLQDDAHVCHNFAAAVERAIGERPDNVISLCVCGLPGKTRKDFLRTLQMKERWSLVNFRGIVHTVALVWPRALAEEILAWPKKDNIPGMPVPPRSDDGVVGAWARMSKPRKEIWATVPSLVEHPDVVESIWGRPARAGKDKGRVAIAWLADGADW